MNPTRILILGGAGILGTEVLRALSGTPNLTV